MLIELKGLLISKRFWVAVGGVLFVLTDAFGLPLTQEQVVEATVIVAAWLVGDSIRASTDKLD